MMTVTPSVTLFCSLFKRLAPLLHCCRRNRSSARPLPVSPPSSDWRPLRNHLDLQPQQLPRYVIAAAVGCTRLKLRERLNCDCTWKHQPLIQPTAAHTHHTEHMAPINCCLPVVTGMLCKHIYHMLSVCSVCAAVVPAHADPLQDPSPWPPGSPSLRATAP
mgnify:CR=1 FL=1